MADSKKHPTDAQIISRLGRSRGGLTAAKLGTSANRLRALDGVVVVGKEQTGKAGRPRLIFALAGQPESPSPAEPSADPSSLSRDGSLSQPPVED